MNLPSTITGVTALPIIVEIGGDDPLMRNYGYIPRGATLTITVDDVSFVNSEAVEEADNIRDGIASRAIDDPLNDLDIVMEYESE